MLDLIGHFRYLTMSALLEVLRQQTLPLTAAQLAGLAKIKPGQAKAELDALAQGGQVFAFTQGKTTAYAAQAPLDLCSTALATRVAQLQAAVPPGRLEKSLPQPLRPWFEEALGRLVVRGQAFWRMSGKRRLIAAQATRPSDSISVPQRQTLQKIFAEANRHRRMPRTLDQFLAWLDADEPSVAPVASAEVTSDLLREWYELDRKRSSTAMIPIPHTFKHYEAWASANQRRADIVDFRQSMEALYSAGAALLEPSERPHELPDHERQLQIPLTFGPPGYYWSPVG